MNYPKIKKHFSLFMVKKTIKKQKKDKTVPIPEENIPTAFQPVCKYIDPIQCYRFDGDIYFQDKIYEEDVSLLSTSNSFKKITNIEFITSSETWKLQFMSLNFPLCSWEILHSRLLTLGDKSAYELAQIIEKIFITSKKEKIYPEEGFGENYTLFLKEFEDLIITKRKSRYFYGKYRFVKSKGFEIVEMGISQEMVKIVFGNNDIFVDYTVNYGLFDFMTIEKSQYFEFMKIAILSVNIEGKTMHVKFQTLDGHWQYIVPKENTRYYFNPKGQLTELILLYEFDLCEDFVKNTLLERENKMKVRKKKTKRDSYLENMLYFYYPAKDFCEKNEIEKGETEEDSLKRCGFKELQNI